MWRQRRHAAGRRPGHVTTGDRRSFFVNTTSVQQNRSGREDGHSPPGRGRVRWRVVPLGSNDRQACKPVNWRSRPGDGLPSPCSIVIFGRSVALTRPSILPPAAVRAQLEPLPRLPGTPSARPTANDFKRGRCGWRGSPGPPGPGQACTPQWPRLRVPAAAAAGCKPGSVARPAPAGRPEAASPAHPQPRQVRGGRSRRGVAPGAHAPQPLAHLLPPARGSSAPEAPPRRPTASGSLLMPNSAPHAGPAPPSRPGPPHHASLGRLRPPGAQRNRRLPTIRQGGARGGAGSRGDGAGGGAAAAGVRRTARNSNRPCARSPQPPPARCRRCRTERPHPPPAPTRPTW